MDDVYSNGRAAVHHGFSSPAVYRVRKLSCRLIYGRSISTAKLLRSIIDQPLHSDVNVVAVARRLQSTYLGRV